MFVRVLIGCALAIGWGMPLARAQDYPTRPIQLIVPFPPGGGTDLAARLAAEFLSLRLGQNVTVINKPGAGTTIGVDLAAKSKPDGYTLIWATSDGISMAPALKPNIPYKVPDDFAFVAATAKVTEIVAVPSKTPFKTLADLIAYGKANPGKLRYSSSGVGGGAHMATALFAKAAGLDLIHVPYAGSNPSVAAAVGGVVDFVLAGSASVKPFSDVGTLRALGTTDSERHPQFPDVPTLEEQGLPDTTVKLYMGVLAPAGTPEPVLARLRKELGEMNKDSKITERLKDLGIDPAYLAGDDFRNFMIKDIARWKDLAASAHIALPE